MTRGTFYLILSDGTIYQSIEFNGDMYIEAGYGTDAINSLNNILKNSENIDSETFKDLIVEFNRTHHNYNDVDTWIYERKNEKLNDLILEQVSDYSYILDMIQHKIRVFHWYIEITDDDIVKNILNDNSEIIEIEVSTEEYEVLAKLGNKFNMSAEEYASKLINDAIKDGTFKNVVEEAWKSVPSYTGYTGSTANTYNEIDREII